MLCVLRVFGKRLDERQLSALLGLAPCSVDDDDGNDGVTNINFEIAESMDRATLLESIKSFLRERGEKVRNADVIAGVEEKILDIAVGFPAEKAALFVQLDKELVERASKAGLSVELSVYKVSEGQ